MSTLAFPGIAIPGATIPGETSAQALPKIFVTGNFEDFITKLPTPGIIQVNPSIRTIVDANNDVVLVVHPFSITLVDGIIHDDQDPDTLAWGKYLPATTYADPSIKPATWKYVFTETFTGRTYDVQLPYDLPGGTFDLSDAVTT